MNPETDCWYPAEEDSYTGFLPEGFEEWRPVDGRCRHDWCLEAQNVRRLFEATPKVSRDDWEAMKADHELMRDEFHTIVVEDTGGYVVVADMEAV